MRLFFLRHGLAEPGSNQLGDFDRALTVEGRAEVDRVTRGLRQLKVRPDPILSSPLVRARQTAEIVAPVIGGRLEIVDELSAGAPPDAFLQLTRRYNAVEALMFVGHESDFSRAAAGFIGAGSRALVLKKAGLIRIDFDGQPSQGRGHLHWLLTPRQLAAIGDTLLDPSAVDRGEEE